MELQYAVLCHRVDIPTQDNEELCLSMLLSSIIVPNASSSGFPLFVSFINCPEGRHDVRVECSNFAREVISTTNHILNCIQTSYECYDSFLVRFPIQKTDLLAFSIYLDGIEQRKIKLAVKVEGGELNP